MERAEPHELRDHAIPVMTARVSEAELAEWFPVSFDEISDPLEAPEPSRGALVKLRDGSYAVLTYGKDSGQLTVELPESSKNRTAQLKELFTEVPLPLSRVLWHRADTRLPRISSSTSSKQRSTARSKKRESTNTSGQRSKRSALRASLPKKAK